MVRRGIERHEGGGNGAGVATVSRTSIQFNGGGLTVSNNNTGQGGPGGSGGTGVGASGANGNGGDGGGLWLGGSVTANGGPTIKGNITGPGSADAAGTGRNGGGIYAAATSFGSLKSAKITNNWRDRLPPVAPPPTPETGAASTT